MKTQILNNIDQIPTDIYQGYIWLSNEVKPTIINNIKITPSDFTNNKNTFIIEGLLYNPKADITFHIVFTHRYIITKFELEGNEHITNKEYIPHKLGSFKLKFDEIWEEHIDINCHNFPTLQFKAQIFKGFSNSKK